LLELRNYLGGDGGGVVCVLVPLLLGGVVVEELGVLVLEAPLELPEVVESLLAPVFGLVVSFLRWQPALPSAIVAAIVVMPNVILNFLAFIFYSLRG
jgi:hypothetical protein